MKRSLFIQNISGIDLNLSDISVRIKAGTTVDVFKYNPRLTKEVLKKSLERGDIKKYSTVNANGKFFCQVVAKPKSGENKTQIKTFVAEKIPMEKPFVVVNPVESIDDNGFLSVDYGFDTSLTKNLVNNLTNEEESRIKTAHDLFVEESEKSAQVKKTETFVVAVNNPVEKITPVLENALILNPEKLETQEKS